MQSIWTSGVDDFSNETSSNFGRRTLLKSIWFSWSSCSVKGMMKSHSSPVGKRKYAQEPGRALRSPAMTGESPSSRGS